jgi:hypothetical protein
MSEITPGDLIRSAWLNADEPTPAPEGEAWRTVPIEPTEAMLVNGREALMPLVRLDSYGPLIGVWEDMLAASPVVPVGVSRETLLKAVRPVLDRHPMIDSSQSHKLDIQAGWVVDAILATLRFTDTGWRDIATAPKDGRVVLVFSAARCVWSVVSAQWRQDWPNGGWDTINKHTTPIVPTHWMPLPPAPTDTGREG